MNSKELRQAKRQFRNLLYKTADSSLFALPLDRLKESLELFKNQREIVSSSVKFYFEKRNQIYQDAINIFELGAKLGYPDELIMDFHRNYFMKAHREEETKKIQPLGETRDNKKSFNFRGGFTHKLSKPWGTNTIKYPSKKRSRKTWKNFYGLFPFLAKQDNWDGKESDKMK